MARSLALGIFYAGVIITSANSKEGYTYDVSIMITPLATRVRDRISIYSQTSIYSKKVKQWKSDLDNSWQCFICDNSELSCQNFYNGSQWGVYDFTMLEIGDFFGINTDLRIDPNSIPHTGTSIFSVKSN